MRVDFAKLESYRRRRRGGSTSPLYGALGAGGLKPLFRREFKLTKLRTKQAAQLAGVVAALYDEVQRGEIARRGFADASASHAIDARALALGSGFGAFEGYAAAPALDPSSASSQGLTPPQPPKRPGDTWAQLIANYSRTEILWAIVWANFRASVTNPYSALDCERGYPWAAAVYNGGMRGDLHYQQQATAAMAYWAATNYAEPVPNVWRQYKPGASWPCDQTICCWIDESGPGGVPALRMTGQGNEGEPCTADSSGTGTRMYESECAPRNAATLSAWKACQARVGAARGPWLSWRHKSSGEVQGGDAAWAAQCARNFPLRDASCPWDPANDMYWKCMTVPTVDFAHSVIQFFNDAWDAVKSAIGACLGSGSLPQQLLNCFKQVADWLAPKLGFPVGTLLAVAAHLDELIDCAVRLLNGSYSLKAGAECFRNALVRTIETAVPLDEIMIAANVLIGNVPGAIILVAKRVVEGVRSYVVDPSVKLVLGIVLASSDFVSMVISQGIEVFRTEAAYMTLGGAVIASARDVTGTSGDVARRVGRAIGNNATLIAMVVNEPSSLVPYVKRKYIEPAQAMLTATVGRIANAGAFIADFASQGDAFEDMAYVLSGLGGVMRSLGEGLNSIPFLGGTGNGFTTVGGVLSAGAADVRHASRIVQNVSDVLSVPPSQLAARAADAIERARIEHADDPAAFAREAQQAMAEAKRAVSEAESEATNWQLPGAIPPVGTQQPANPANAPAPASPATHPAQPPATPPAAPPSPSTPPVVHTAAPARASAVGPAIAGGVVGALLGGPIGAAVGVGLFGAIAAAKKG